MQMMELSEEVYLKLGSNIINGKYRVINEIYNGPQSKIYSVSFEKNGLLVVRVIKVQSVLAKSQSLKNEVNVIKNIFMDRGRFCFKAGFSRLYEFGIEKGYNYSVFGINGPNLLQLLKLCGGKFGKRTLALVALQIVDRIQVLHEKKYLYLNFHPENFVVGLGSESFLIKMVGFSKCEIFKSKNKNTHIPYQSKAHDLDPHFCSVNTQLNIQPSRRDDIESMIYLIVYMFKGKLPWSKVDSLNKKELSNAILEIKRKISAESLLKGLPLEYVDIMYYAKTLNFYEQPDYDLIRKKLWAALMETDYEELKNNIIMYDWHTRESLDFDIYRDKPKIVMIQNKAEKESHQQENISVSDRSSSSEDILV